MTWTVSPGVTRFAAAWRLGQGIARRCACVLVAADLRADVVRGHESSLTELEFAPALGDLEHVPLLFLPPFSDCNVRRRTTVEGCCGSFGFFGLV